MFCCRIESFMFTFLLKVKRFMMSTCFVHMLVDSLLFPLYRGVVKILCVSAACTQWKQRPNAQHICEECQLHAFAKSVRWCDLMWCFYGMIGAEAIAVDVTVKNMNQSLEEQNSIIKVTHKTTFLRLPWVRNLYFWKHCLNYFPNNPVETADFTPVQNWSAKYHTALCGMEMEFRVYSATEKLQLKFTCRI